MTKKSGCNMKVTIHKGNPTPEQWAEIGRMIQEGHHTGIDRPYGINWEVDCPPPKAFIVSSKDIFDRKKNPNLSFSVEDIARNPKIPKKRIK